MDDTSKLNDLRLAFLARFSFENGAAVRGAVLVTDIDTKPLEFRVTEPVRPSSFQKTLYGEILDEHILVEIIGLPLLHSLQERYDVVLVREPEFLGINNKQKTLVIRILREDELKVTKATTTEQIETAGSYFLLEALKNMDKELIAVRQQLVSVFASRDLFEPFDRIRTACEQLQSGENKG